jgi:phage terminase large subunit
MGDASPWCEVVDEYTGDASGHFQERHYNEFVTFLPYVQRFLYGEFGQLKGLVYDNFNPENHIIDDCDLKGGRIFRAVDFGFVHPFVCLWFHMASDETVTIFKELVQSGVTIDKLTERMIEQSAGLKIEATCSDHDAGERALMAKAGMATVKADKSVLPGINSVYSLLSRDKLRVFRSCKKTIDGFYAYRWKENAKKDEVVKEHDDEMDAVRYGIQTFVAKGPAVSVGTVNWL